MPVFQRFSQIFPENLDIYLHMKQSVFQHQMIEENNQNLIEQIGAVQNEN